MTLKSIFYGDIIDSRSPRQRFFATEMNTIIFLCMKTEYVSLVLVVLEIF